MENPEEKIQETKTAVATNEAGLATQALTFKQHEVIRAIMLALPKRVTPNRVTVFGGLCVVPVVWLILIGRPGWALAIFVFARILDFVDGALAAARDQKSPLGEFLDPLADKILTCGTLVAVLPQLPTIFLFATVLVFFYAVALTRVRIIKLMEAKKNGTPSATIAAPPAGKWKTVLETVALPIILLGLTVPSSAFVWLGGAVLMLSLVYADRSLTRQQRS